MFPERIYTIEEVKKAQNLIKRGHKHRLIIKGSSEFKFRVNRIIDLIKTAEYLEFMRTYIRQIIEIGGISQLRETNATIWANIYTVTDPVNASTYFIEKAHMMKNYINGAPYSETDEIGAVAKSVEFLKALKTNSKDKNIIKKCNNVLELLAGNQVL